jgi:hypothetical protein
MDGQSCAVCNQHTSKRCGRCNTQYFCSKDCQKKVPAHSLTANIGQGWSSHKGVCKFDGGPAIPLGDPSHPSVLLVSFGKESWFDEIGAHLLEALKSRAAFTEATSPAEFVSLTSGGTVKPTAILITTSFFAEDKYSAIHQHVVQYARQGGVVVFCALFSSMISPPKMTEMWRSQWNLPWKSAGYDRWTFELNPERTQRLQNIVSLPGAYSMKAVSLSGLSTESSVYAVRAQAKESPAAFMPYGSGYVGYLGDVNAEVESTAVILGMCGLLE